jgi:hypothetical protein
MRNDEGDERGPLWPDLLDFISRKGVIPMVRLTPSVSSAFRRWRIALYPPIELTRNLSTTVPDLNWPGYSILSLDGQ